MNFKYVMMSALFLPLALTACLEPQPAPELPERASSAFNIEIIADGLNTPWSVAELDDGSFLITEKQGQIKHVKDGAVKNISGVPDDLFTEGQAGLFDIYVADDGIVYLAYAFGDVNANGTALIRGELNGNAIKNAQEIFRASPTKDAASHYGGRIVDMEDGTLILTLGDGFAYREAAQDLGSHLGKIVRIRPDGSVPTDNPFTDRNQAAGEVKYEIYSYGHRNVQGAHYDAQTGTLWAHEHGPRGGDELNIIQPGENYGWPVATTGLDYNGAKITPFEDYDSMTAPVYDWVPSIAPSGLTIYRGHMFPEWDGDALVGALAKKSLRRVDIENGKVVGEEILLGDLNARVREVRTAKDGSVLVLVNTTKDMEPGGGQLLRVRPNE